MFRYGLALVALHFVNPEAHAQSYPSRPVQIVVPLAAGGAADTIARATARRLSEMWNQQVIVENKSGANTQIGATQVSKSAPDGHTLLVSAETTFVVNPYLYSKLSYDPGKDFVTVSGLAIVNQLLLVHPSVPAQNVQDLIALAKEKPHSVTFGTYGVGSAGHLNMELFQAMAGVQMRAVHYRGGAPALTDLIGGHIDSLVISVGQAQGPVDAGQVRALAAGSKQRLEKYPKLPTVSESGVPGYESVSYFGMVAPAGTPREIVLKINADVQRIMSDPGFKSEVLAKNHFDPIIGSPEEFDAYMKADARKWEKIIKDANLTVD